MQLEVRDFYMHCHKKEVTRDGHCSVEDVALQLSYKHVYKHLLDGDGNGNVYVETAYTNAIAITMSSHRLRSNHSHCYIPLLP